METLYTSLIFGVLLLVIGVPYWLKAFRHRKEAKQIHGKTVKAGLGEPVTLHPKIDITTCIGCASCVKICPESVLGIVDGRAAVISGLRCVGHSLCADICPVGAITMTFGTPRAGMEIPVYDENYKTNIEGLYIVGELGGIGLIRNAIEQGKKAIGHIASMPRTSREEIFDVAIIGAGPAGIGAALAAKASNLSHVVLEQYDLGGSILHYPRQKLVLTSPVELPLYGKLKVSEISKEELLELFTAIVKDFALRIRTGEKVESITKESGIFQIKTGMETFRASHVVLALGRRGSPKKLDVPGEHLPKVSYRLIEAEKYTNKNILVVGGGDSAVEAAIGLARQKGNTVSVSYRREDFVRLKEKNDKEIRESIKSGRVRAIFNSEVTEIQPNTVLVQEQKIIHNLKNDFVFIFAGGELPSEFLKKIGVQLRTEEIKTNAA